MLRRGDTLIEVMLAVSVFSLVAVSSMTIMNKGMSMVQRSLETTLVRQQLDAQAEMLRFIHSRALDNDEIYGDIWDNVRSSPVVTPKQLIGAESCPEKGSELTDGFILVPNEEGKLVKKSINTPVNYLPAETYAKVDSDGLSHGVSVQLVRLTGKGAYDAYIQGCWYGFGLEKPMTIGTIVRLYDPGA